MQGFNAYIVPVFNKLQGTVRNLFHRHSLDSRIDGLNTFPEWSCHAVLLELGAETVILGVTDTRASFPSPFLVFLLYSPHLIICTHTSDHIKSLYLPWWLCHVSSFHLFMLLLFHLFC